jgi:hypothetical protein
MVTGQMAKASCTTCPGDADWDGTLDYVAQKVKQRRGLELGRKHFKQIEKVELQTEGESTVLCWSHSQAATKSAGRSARAVMHASTKVAQRLFWNT